MGSIHSHVARQFAQVHLTRARTEGREGDAARAGSPRLARMAGLLALGALIVLMPTATARAAGQGPYSLEILVDGRPLPEYPARGKIYVEALRGREYSIRLRNHTAERVAIALGVDGLSTIDARTTPSRQASKWILEPWGSLTLDGWQTSSSTARRFFFTSEERSYGAWLGRTRNFGLISAAVYREVRPEPAPITMREEPGWDRLEGRGDEMRGPAGEGDDAGARQRFDRDPGSGAPSPEGRSKTAPRTMEVQPQPSDDYAATGIGREVDHSVRRIQFVTERHPAAVLEIRYEFRDALARLGVLPVPCAGYEDPLYRRERSRGFDAGGFAPDPFEPRCR